MKIGIVGTRTFEDYDLLVRTMNRIRKMFDDRDITIVSGGSRGADSLGEQYSRDVLKKDAIVFPADWGTYGKSAGFKRNIDIVNASDMMVAFWDGRSRGTNDSMNKATKAGKPILVVPFNVT